MGGSTMHDTALRVAAEAFMATDGASTVGDALRRLREGFWAADYVDAFFQKGHWRSPLDIYDAYGFLRLHTLSVSGMLYRAQVNVYAEPVADAAIEENNRRLSGISAPFSAEFVGGTGDNDGHVAWSEPVRLVRDLYDCDQHACSCVRDAHEVWFDKGRRAVLEVGSTAVSRTWLHLAEGSVLARWPYRHTWMTLLWLDRAQAGIGRFL